MTVARKDSPALGWVREKVVTVFGAELRSLAAFRIVLGVLVLADLANRATDLSAHYSDTGVLPRTVLVDQILSPWAFSLNLMNGEPFFQALLFGIGALAALGLLVGYRTRLMTVVVWVILLSIQWRNPLVSGSDAPLLRILLFWGMFLPLGAYWSVDRALKPAPRRLSMRFLSMATAALFMQIAFVYWFTALLKSGPEWRVDGTAIYYALSIDQIATPLGHFLLHFPRLLEVLTFATIGLEAFGPLLLFCPFLTGPVRTGAVMAFMSLHFGIWLTMDIGIFPWISAFCMVCFLPTWFWDEVVPKLRAAVPKRIDIARRLRPVAERLANAYRLPLQARLSSLVGQPPTFAGLALHGAADNLSQNQTVGMILTPTTTKTWRGEVRPAERGAPRGRATGPEAPMLPSSLVVDLVAFCLLLYVLCWNLTTVSALTMPERLAPVGPFLGLDQYWGMFAPAPTKDDGWYVIPGNLRDGQQTDLMSVTRDDFTLHKVSWAKPQDVTDTFKNEHWRKYLEFIGQEQYASQRLYFGRYICREWNARHSGPEQLRTFQITFMREETLPDYQKSTPEKVVLWEHSCF